jgi:hypothetical protein
MLPFVITNRFDSYITFNQSICVNASLNTSSLDWREIELKIPIGNHRL